MIIEQMTIISGEANKPDPWARMNAIEPEAASGTKKATKAKKAKAVEHQEAGI
jgi:hypothetical protein